MRHRKHNHILGVKTQHRKALLSNLCAALVRHGRIRTTVAKAKALRPVVEKMITRAKKAKASNDAAVRLHHRRQCARHLRDKEAAHLLFNEKVDEFTERDGGYVRIYKLGKVRLGDSAEMALVELVPGSDEGYAKRRKKKTSTKSKPSSAEKRSQTQPIKESETAEDVAPETDADSSKEDNVDQSNEHADEDKPDTSSEDSDDESGSDDEANEVVDATDDESGEDDEANEVVDATDDESGEDDEANEVVDATDDESGEDSASEEKDKAS
jgi:large subunit ribosomal protein L17